MRKSKILGIALAAAMVSSFAAVSVSAVTEASELKDHVVGITGSFCNWGTDPDTAVAIPDVVMTDDDNDGVWEADIVIEQVTEGMIQEQETDLGPVGGVVKTGKEGVCFKVRLDNAWSDTGNWGVFEPAYIRTENSQTNFCAECSVGDSVTIHVKFDTTTVDPQDGADADDKIEMGSGDEHIVWPVTFTVENNASAPVEESSEEPAEESSETPAEESSETPAEESSETPAEESSETPAEESSETPAASTTEESTAPATDKDGDTSTVATGDTTSAVALVAVVIASLGAAVVMTKKASKE